MFDNFLKTIGLDIPASVLGAIGTVIETVGELTDNDTIQSVGQTIRENSDDIAS